MSQDYEDDDVPEIDDTYENPEEDTEDEDYDYPDDDSEVEGGEEESEEESKDAAPEVMAEYDKKAEADKFKVQVVYEKEREFPDIMSQFEYARLISIRASHIETNGVVFTEIGNLSDPISIAKKELRDGKCPLLIRKMRKIEISKDGKEIHYIERADPNKMVIPCTRFTEGSQP